MPERLLCIAFYDTNYNESHRDPLCGIQNKDNPLLKMGYAKIQRELQSILEWLIPAATYDLNPVGNAKPDKWKAMKGLEGGTHSLKMPTEKLEIEGDGLPVVVETKGRRRTPRIVDAPVMAVLRLHTLFGETARLESNTKDATTRRDYMVIFSEGTDKIHLLRLIVDAAPGNHVSEAPGSGGYDYRREALTLPPRSEAELKAAGELRKNSFKGREFAIAHSLGNYDKFLSNNDSVPISRDGYEALMRLSYALLDRIPLGFTLNKDPEAA